ncbi:hypothetical protein PHLCEN_2v9886 [Hermanssonia centrifuga]|uniref:Uncharacterized protein n=1 Tax=Hermanssonia centrifuga TaxID=98765 RepID=A0A2R6NPH0_9APHY|nr:hypothetical protein PHLCEN_2v9886 [Hermanssonia centrifuga]
MLQQRVRLSSSHRVFACHSLEAYIKSRDDEKERRRREALRRIAPGFEPQSTPLVPTKRDSNVPDTAFALGVPSTSDATEHARSKSVMEDLVDHLAALDSK